FKRHYNGASQRCLSFWPDSESVLRKLRSYARVDSRYRCGTIAARALSHFDLNMLSLWLLRLHSQTMHDLLKELR
ncbi:unnamed protein product, partial [Oikopleura dioica]